ncbi:MAG: hypothetical protein N2449_03470 [Bacteroidales bacterium]|nr:hypothetical protein [Bacteroidales bacterium]
MEQIKIIGILIKDRIKEANHTQAVLTKYAHLIRTRLGFHEVSEYTCSRIGFIVLQVIDKNDEYKKFRKELDEIYGIEVQEMNFSW